MYGNLDQLQKSDIRRIADEGKRIYRKIKDEYDPKEKGKFLAIDIESEDIFLGDTSSDALLKAKEKYPDKIFYVVKIGYDSIATMAKRFLGEK